MQSLLLICADALLSNNIIRKMENEYTIWHVARQRDAMAWLNNHQPQTVVIDLDLLGQPVHHVIDKVRSLDVSQLASVIGVCKSPEALAPHLVNQLDQLIVLHSV